MLFGDLIFFLPTNLFFFTSLTSVPNGNYASTYQFGGNDLSDRVLIYTTFNDIAREPCENEKNIFISAGTYNSFLVQIP